MTALRIAKIRPEKTFCRPVEEFPCKRKNSAQKKNFWGRGHLRRARSRDGTIAFFNAVFGQPAMPEEGPRSTPFYSVLPLASHVFAVFSFYGKDRFKPIFAMKLYKNAFLWLILSGSLRFFVFMSTTCN